MLLSSLFLLVIKEEVLEDSSYPQRIFSEDRRFYTFEPHSYGVYDNSIERKEWFVNNEGWIDTQKFPKIGNNLNLILGDSYIQSLEVDSNYYLSNLLSHVGAFNQIGMAGASFAQYVVWIKYYALNYSVDTVILSLNSQDFNEANISYRRLPGLYQFDDNNEIRFEMINESFSLSRIKFLKRIYIASPKLRMIKRSFLCKEEAGTKESVSSIVSLDQLELLHRSLTSCKLFVLYDELGNSNYTGLVVNKFPNCIVFDSFNNDKNIISSTNKHWSEDFRDSIVRMLEFEFSSEEFKCIK